MRLEPPRPSAGPSAPRAARAEVAPDAGDFAAALGEEPEALLDQGLLLDEEERASCTLVRLHFLANRPAPAVFPRIALRLLELLLEPEVDVVELCRLVELDAAVAAAVLARANSAASRALDPIETVPHAVTRLGLSEVSRVASASALRTLYDRNEQAAFSACAPLWPILFRHAVVTGRLAGDLARGRPDAGADLAFMAGLLHDVGMAVALRSLAALTLDGTLPSRAPESGLRILAEVHVELGIEASWGWRLPARLLEVVARHHEAGAHAPRPAMVELVRVASALDLRRCAPEANPGAVREAVEATRTLGGSPAWLAAAVVRHGDAVAWTLRSLASA